MPDFKMERDAVLRRWYGGNPQHRDPSPRRNPEEPIRDNDYLGIPVQTNTPFLIFGKCLVWKYGLNQDGYGYLRTDGKVQLAHRLAYAQAYGQILDGTQINHLCNRPYCLQPAHLYAGTHQDNKDDERVFGMEDGQLTIAPILMAPEKQFENQLLSRLQQSARFRGNVVVWEAPLQPPQVPLEEFECPGHNYVIPVSGSTTRLCRICERWEDEEERLDDFGIPMIIADIYPASQAIPTIFNKIASSGLTGESYRAWWRRIHNRTFLASGDHNLRNCECRFCTQDRAMFRETIQPWLSQEESDILDLCDRAEPKLREILQKASADVLQILSRELELNEDQEVEFKAHLQECLNTRQNFRKHAHILEREIGYFLYEMRQDRTLRETLEKRPYWMRLRRVRIRENDRDRVAGLIPLVEQAGNEVYEMISGESDSILGREYPAQEEVRALLRAQTEDIILDHLRYELTGRNSSEEIWPHPHSRCLENILMNGQAWQGFTLQEEGQGLRPDDV